jgi:hypothetical protein
MENTLTTYKCQKCDFSFTKADRAWDEAVTNGMCPKCKLKLTNFPIERFVTKEKEITDTFKCDNCKNETKITDEGNIYWIIKSPLIFMFRGRIKKICKSCGFQVNLGGCFFLVLFVLYHYVRIKEKI